jgi:hypothetical protein
MAADKKVLALLLGKRAEGPKDEEATAADPKGEALNGLHMAMEEFLSAVEAKDPAAMADALKSALSMCHDEDADEEY